MINKQLNSYTNESRDNFKLIVEIFQFFFFPESNINWYQGIRFA